MPFFRTPEHCTRHGEHQEPDQAEPLERTSAPAQPGRALRAEDPHQDARRTAIETGTDDAPEAVRLAQKRLGKAASKGRIHKNAAARRTSRLMKKAVQRSLLAVT